jgi:hypothetical protein
MKERMSGHRSLPRVVSQGEKLMKKILLAGACALALSATGAFAQSSDTQGGTSGAKSGSTTMSPGGHMKKEHTGKTTGSATHKSGAKAKTGGQGATDGGADKE